MSMFVCRNKVEVVSIRESDNRRVVEWVAMSSFSLKIVNDGVEAKNKD